LVYNGNFGKSGTDLNTTGTEISTARIDRNKQLHNVRADYMAPFGLSVGAEYTHYNKPSNQLLKSTFEGEEWYFRTEDQQTIDRWKVFAGQEHSLGSDWELNYGVDLEWARDKSFQWYYDPATGQKIHVAGDGGFSSLLDEQTQNVYAGFSKAFSEKWQMDGSLAVEHFKNAAWNDWSVYPTLNLTWLPAAGHIVQLGLSSDKGYPDYWSLQSTTTHSNAYTEIVGNPSLRPKKEYQAALSYILKSKYVFTAYFSHTKDYFIQLLYQNPDRLVQTYRVLNEDFMQQAGIQATIPFAVGDWWNAQTRFIGAWQREKDSDFYDIPFDRNIFFGMVIMNNTFTLSKKHNLKLLVNGMIRSKGIQGNYDLPASGNLDASLRWGFADGRGLLNIFCSDIFQTRMISPVIDYGGQYVHTRYKGWRRAGVALTWKFGGYTEKRREAVDTGRFR
ncbi:MAG: TonB-dependent receptor family protein, partial [Bacteroidales bacterium]|nr:TonB-dependent receptor family protein [Bacteroidales bacterium]